MACATQTQIRRGTTAQNNAFTGVQGEVTYDVNTNELRTHDGVTLGGFIIPTLTDVNTLLASYLPLAGGTMSGAINLGGFAITNLLNPVNPQDAATKSYVDTGLALKLSLSGGTMSGAINMGGFAITNLLNPVNPQDAATKTYVDAGLALKLSLSGGTMSGAINMGSNFITNLLNPVNPQDAATKAYTDAAVSGPSVSSKYFNYITFA